MTRVANASAGNDNNNGKNGTMEKEQADVDVHRARLYDDIFKD
jgi:hypothetical protein